MSEYDIKIRVLEELLGEMRGLTSRYKDPHKICASPDRINAIQDAYAFVVGFRNSIKDNKGR